LWAQAAVRESRGTQKAGGKLGWPAGGWKCRHLSKSRRAQRAQGICFALVWCRRPQSLSKPKRVGGRGVEAEAACIG